VIDLHMIKENPMNSKEIYWKGKHVERADRNFHGCLRERFDRGVFNQAKHVLRSDSTVVDIGAGTGYLTRGFAEMLREGKVIAVDESSEMLDKLIARSKRHGIRNRVHIHPSDASQVGLADNTADIVVSAHLLHEVPDPERVMKEAWRILKPGGILVVQDFRRGPISLVFRFTHHKTAAGPLGIREIHDMLDAIGFTDIIVKAGVMRYTASARK